MYCPLADFAFLCPRSQLGVIEILPAGARGKRRYTVANVKRQNGRCPMRLEKAEKQSRTGEKVNVAVMNADEQTRRMDAAIARRAYEIFENRGSASWHELEDWRQAESELVRALCFGQMTVGDNLWVGTDAASFEEGTINIWVAPRRLTIWGKPRVTKQAAPPQRRSNREEIVFRVADLAVEVDPSKVTAKLNGRSLEILLKRAQPKLEPATKGAAA